MVVRRALFSRELCRNGTNLYPVAGVLAGIYSGRRVPVGLTVGYLVAAVAHGCGKR